MNITELIRKERETLQQRVDALDSALAALDGRGRAGRKAGRRGGWKMSRAARMKIARAQRARWAKMKS